MNASTPRSVTRPDDAALSAWLEQVQEPVSIGILHTLSNRMCAMEAIAALPAEVRAEPGSRLGDAQLRTEIAQAIDLQRVLRGLLPDSLPAEALDLRDVAREALRLAEHHPRMRKSVKPGEVTGDSAATRFPRWVLRRILLTFAVSGARAEGVMLTVTAGADEHVVSVGAGTGEGGGGAIDYAMQLGADAGARVERDDSGYRLFVPSLAELRRRDGLAG